MDSPKRRLSEPRVDKFKFYDLVIYAARGSSSARRLATTLGCRRWRDDLPTRYTRRRPYFRGNNSPMVLNWGSTIHPKWLEDERFRLEPNFVNHGDRVKTAINKLAFFQCASRINGVPLPKWTEKRNEALAWIAKGKYAVCRTKLDGSSGSGIVLARSSEECVNAKLYTRLYPKTHEFRVHVFGGQVIDLTQKKLKGGEGVINTRFVRSLDNGWVHAHNGIQLSEADQRILAVASCSVVGGLGLTFGAVDILAILDGDSQDIRPLKSFVVCEVNTGPGLENTQTINAYTKAILRLKTGETISPKSGTEKNDGNIVERISGDQPENSL
jgi:hypothetical protein